MQPHSPHPLRIQLGRLMWAAVEMTIFRNSFHTFSRWRVFLLRIFGAKIGPGCKIRRTARFYYPWNVTLGAGITIGDDANIYSLATIQIGDRATISQEAFLCAGTHDAARLDLPLVVRPISIGEEAWVCARAFVGPGVTVGRGAIVAACGVAVKDVPQWTIVGGNPAKHIKDRVIAGTDQG